MVQLVVYVPLSHLQIVKDAIFAAGAGSYQNYDQCCWESHGVGQFRPLEGADPFIGVVGHVEALPEVKIETICREEVVLAVIEALKKAHPYEEPAFGLFRMMDGV